MKLAAPFQCVAWSLLVIVLSVTTADPLWAQGRGGRGRGDDRGGDRDRGGEEGRGGREGMRGGFGGGPPGMMPGGGFGGGPPGMMPGGGFGGGPPGMMPGGGFGGGPPGMMPGGGPPGMAPGGGPTWFLARMDANGNGMLEPDEMQGRARMMLERMAGDAELDLSRPIPLATIERAFNEMRERRMGEGGDPRFRGGDGEEGGGRGGSRQAEPEPLVAGFGEVDLFDPVPGFGAEGERYAVKIAAEDREEALRTLTRYDNNKDGLLDGDEIRNARWSDDPLSTDRNRDGKLTLTELALRYAMRRAQRDGESGDNAQASGNRSGNNRSARSGGQSAPRGNSSEDENRNRWAEMLFGRFDRDGNNVLEGDELSEFRGSERFDANQDGKITRDEIGQAMSNMRGRGGGGPGGEQGGRGNFFARREDGGEGREQSGGGGGGEAAASGRKSYRRTTAADRLADLEGLPEWFARSDADQDGQIRMAEYGSSWSDELVADFMQFDLNGDGIITPQECLDASEKGAVQGVTSGSGSSSRGGGFGSRGRERSAERRPDSAAGVETAASSAAAATAPAAAGNVSDRYVKFAVGVIKKYDKNGDGVLTEDEWKSMPDDRAKADTDQDGRITPVELATAYSQDS